MVPFSLRYQIASDFHSKNHWAAADTYNEIRKQYYWPNMLDYIQKFCASCDDCLKTKKPNKKPIAPLKPIDWAACNPRESIGYDIATIAPSYDGFRFVLLIIDGMSKYVELCPLRNATAVTLARVIKREWIGRHGHPTYFLSDQGQNVDQAEEIKELCEKLGIKKTDFLMGHK